MNRIKQLREEYHFSQNDLAERLGGAPSSVAMYEREERKPSLEVLVKLSEIFDCSIDYILGISDIKNMREDPIGLAKIGFNMKDYNPPTESQKQQIEELIKVILKDNKKEDK